MVPGGLAELGEVTLPTAYLTAHEGQVLVHVPLLQASLGVQTPAQKAWRCMAWGRENHGINTTNNNNNPNPTLTTQP